MVPEDVLEKVAVTKLKLDKDRKAKGRVATDKEKGTKFTLVDIMYGFCFLMLIKQYFILLISMRLIFTVPFVIVFHYCVCIFVL
ncbi:hypothetical protein JHK87_026651 [Glycine soja]|nr:hypothetical protein JHK87_026651 [Glycine soja]